MRKNIGITLISLVVTIVVLIILAGVSINMLVGDNGIITLAQKAKEKTIYAGQEEQEQLNQLYLEIGESGIDDSGKKDEIIELLQKQVEELQQQIDDQATQIADLESQISNKDENINNVQSELDNLKTELAKANATEDKILSGYTAYSNNQLLTGTMPLKNGSSKALAISTGENGLYQVFSTGFYPSESHFNLTGTSEVYSSYADVANALDITSSKIAQGQSIAGIAGNYTSDANATANNLSNGTTAYVNGQKIIGNGSDVTNSYNNGYNAGYTAGSSTGKESVTVTFTVYGENGGLWIKPKTYTVKYGQTGNFETDGGTANHGGVCSITSWN